MEFNKMKLLSQTLRASKSEKVMRQYKLGWMSKNRLILNGSWINRRMATTILNEKTICRL